MYICTPYQYCRNYGLDWHGRSQGGRQPAAKPLFYSIYIYAGDQCRYGTIVLLPRADSGKREKDPAREI